MPSPRVSFFTTGDVTSYGSSYIITNQCYVQYISPRVSSSPTDRPLLFIHGGGLTGSQWETTPDRRPGWAVRAAEQGRHVYIMDGVDSGRSQRAPENVREGEFEWRDAKQMWERFRFGPLDGWEQRKSYEDSAFDTKYLNQLVGMQAVRRRTTDDVEWRGIQDVIEELAVDGPIDIIAHSHGAALLVHGSKGVRSLLNKVVLVEPGTTSHAANLVQGLQSLIVWGDHIEENKIWSSFKATFDEIDAQTMVLKDEGIVGNSHFPMNDANSDLVWTKVSNWIDAEI